MSVPQLRRQNEDVHLNVLDGLPADHEAAIGVWRAANIARLLPPALSGWPGSGRSWPILARAWSLATSTRAGTCWLWRWRNPVARRTAQERSSPATATCPWCSSTPTCGDGVSAASCCRDYTSVHRKGDGAVRRCGPGRRTRALDAFTKARDTERQATRPHLATVAPSSSSSVKHADPRRSVVDRASGTSTLSGPLQQPPHRGERRFRKPVNMQTPSGVALRATALGYPCGTR